MKQFRFLIWVLAIAISIISTFLISLIGDVNPGNLWVVFLLILAPCVLFMNFMLHFLISKDFEKIEALLFDWLDNPKNLSKRNPSYFFSRFSNLDHTIRSTAKQREKRIWELEQMSDFRREFIANISHELKTPIFSAQGFVHTLLDGALKDKNVRNKFLKKAAKSLDALDLLVQDLLTLSQIEIGDIKMHYEYFDIVKQTREVIDQLEEQAEKKEVKVSIKPNHKQILVYADYHRMHQVMNNLIINAIKYNNDGGRVRVSFEENSNFVEIKVADNGEGIPEEHLSRIFERFYRVDKSRSRRGGGTGLGLAIVKHILEGHKTSVKVSSRVGGGTVFTFRLARGEEVIKQGMKEDVQS